MTAPTPAQRAVPQPPREFTAFEVSVRTEVEAGTARMCRELDGLRKRLGADEDEVVRALFVQGFGRAAADYSDWLDTSQEVASHG